jgi:hypothetical protein
MVVDELSGEPRCIVCKNDLVLDIHHIRTDKKMVFLCPNHHQMIHRNIFTANMREKSLSLKQIIDRIKKIEMENKPYLKLEKIYQRREDPFEVDRVKNARFYSSLRDLNEKQKEEYLDTEVASFSLNYGIGNKVIEKNKLISLKPKCFICKYSTVLDVHHVYQNDKLVFLCPNHHSMIHRHLGDRDGKKYNLEQIKDKVEEIEEGKLAYYTEVSREQYSKKYKGYKTIRIKTPSICKSCNQWFFPKSNRKDICSYCWLEIKEKS